MFTALLRYEFQIAVVKSCALTRSGNFILAENLVSVVKQTRAEKEKEEETKGRPLLTARQRDEFPRKIGTNVSHWWTGTRQPFPETSTPPLRNETGQEFLDFRLESILENYTVEFAPSSRPSVSVLEAPPCVFVGTAARPSICNSDTLRGAAIEPIVLCGSASRTRPQRNLSAV